MCNYEEIYQTIKKIAKFALIKAIPIFLGYLFLGITFGLLLQGSSLGMFWAFLISTLVYAGPVQFALVDILIGGLSYMTTAVVTLFINSRHAFYGLTFVERFKGVRKAYSYMVFSPTDEIYSLPCSMTRPPDFTDRKREATTFSTSFSDQYYQIAGSMLGALMDKLITFDTTGIDFATTASLVVTCVDQWKTAETHIPAVTGSTCGVLFLVLIRSSNSILPALTATVIMLLLLCGTVEQKMKED